MNVQDSCGSDCQTALRPGEHHVATELFSTLPVHWNCLIPGATFQDRLYMEICGVMNVLTEFDI